jgi:antagonist of KipI
MQEVIIVKAGDTLSFLEPQKGTVAYIGMNAFPENKPWLNSFSESTCPLKKNQTISLLPITSLPQQINPNGIQKIADYIFETHPIEFIPGPAWNDLDNTSIASLLQNDFNISLQSNRMGYPLKGPILKNKRTQSYLSSGVTRGTIQLLPSGELIILMSDHQTIGGYANLGQIILVDLPRLAQWNKLHPLRFKISTIESAHTKYREIQQLLVH